MTDGLLAQLGDDALLLEPREHFDQAVVAVEANPSDHWPRKGGVAVAVYDAEACIDAIKGWLKCDDESAWDYFGYNTSGAWVGEGTPTFRYSDEL